MDGSVAEQTDVDQLSFERALAELEAIVARLEQGDVPLEQSIELYEKGERLKRHCDRLLKAAEARVDKITTDTSGRAVGTEPLDPS